MNNFNISQCLKITLIVGFYFLLNVFTEARAQAQLTVIVPNFPPYTLKSNDQISGIGVDLADKIFKRAGITVRYRIAPNYAKALHELEQGRADALLLASQNDERDNMAVFSKPLMINRWCWYLLNDTALDPYDSNFKRDAKISSHFKSNTHKWLIKNGYSVLPARRTNTLPQMLIRSRVDAVFIAELVFETAVKQNQLISSQFKKYIEKKKPFGIYISKEYLAKYPETLTKVNQAIDETIIADL